MHPCAPAAYPSLSCSLQQPSHHSQDDPSRNSALQFFVGALVCWAGALLLEDAPGQLAMADYMNLGYLSIVCTTVCFLLQAYGLKYTPSSEGSIIFYHEQVTFKIFAGFALIFIAVIVVNVRRK